jgi:anaerobic selenocysteine-containing dehydrogenase
VAAAEIGERSSLPARAPYEVPAAATTTATVAVPSPEEHFLGELRLVRYRPLFSGPLVERVPELAFQRPDAEIELAAADAERREIAEGDVVAVRSNGTSLSLRAKLSRRLMPGVARIAEEHAGDLHATVEVLKA